jgi:hypothetical protein
MQALAGRVVLATGGATGIGRSGLGPRLRRSGRRGHDRRRQHRRESRDGTSDMSPSTHRLTEPHGTG